VIYAGRMAGDRARVGRVPRSGVVNDPVLHKLPIPSTRIARQFEQPIAHEFRFLAAWEHEFEPRLPVVVDSFGALRSQSTTPGVTLREVTARC
jgi:hypothetical protein